MKLKINPAFRDLLRPLTAEEYKNLEQEIVADGCREPIVVWNETIIDGHHRYKICQKHGIDFTVKVMTFPSEAEALFWIGRNQKGRRNLNAAELALLALEVEPVFREKARENIREGGAAGGKGLPNSAKALPKINTRQEIAKIAGLGASTIHEAKKVKESGDQKLIDQMKSGEKSIHGAYTEVMRRQESELSPATKVCSMCGLETPISEMSGNGSYCKKCASFHKRNGSEAQKIKAFKDVDVNAIIESMAKKEPSDDGRRHDSDNHIIADYVALVKDFRTSVNRFVYMPAAFKGMAQDDEAIIETEKLLSELSTIIKNAKGE